MGCYVSSYMHAIPSLPFFIFGEIWVLKHPPFCGSSTLFSNVSNCLAPLNNSFISSCDESAFLEASDISTRRGTEPPNKKVAVAEEDYTSFEDDEDSDVDGHSEEDLSIVKYNFRTCFVSYVGTVQLSLSSSL